MKHGDSERAALNAALCRLGLELEDEIQEKLLTFLDLVIEKNKVLNLTRITSYEEAIILHLEDSLSIFNEFGQTTGKFLDIGTGAGFPGIPLGITTGRKGTLLDSVKKKVIAVDEFIKQLGMEDQLDATGLRSEELAQQVGAKYGVVTARAVSSLPAVEELAAPLLIKGGKLIAMRGIDTQEDIDQAKKAAKILGLKLVDRREFTIGGGEFTRSVCVFEKVGKPQIKLPRHPGYASKKPLV